MASSSSSSHSILASSQKWKYDVFPSFRGEDTRKTFVDHLYTALEQQGIYTYKDDEKLPRGESIGPSLLKAIEESQIAIVVFSKNYADSSWCLDELAHVLKCREERGLIVMPVFYDVEPSEVRKQKRRFGEGFSKHESENSNKVEFWRKALVDACNISGWEPKKVANGHEGKCIKEIVNTISHRVHPRISGIDENLIGIEVRIEDLKSKLQIESNVVLMIGIWGLGGGGKTTLASAIYHQISRKFDGCCFVENVREDSRKYSLKKLQEQVLSGVLKEKVKVQGVEEGRRMIMSRLCHRKVLIVLDDVDDREQLEALTGSHDWFGEGSRIIITTRDKHVLNAHKVNVVHNIRLLNDEDGMKLFCKHAPQGSMAVEDYKLLSRKVVSYACGLPLALNVIGCFLCDKDISEWKSALARLEKIPETSIVEKLKISYDGLRPTEKELFLDIACFFRRRHYKREAMEILDACGFYPEIGIKVLIQKALITISEEGAFDMHDLIQEMGHYIVRGEHPDNPEKHSRVWEEEDARKICAMDKTMALDDIKAIRHGPYWMNDRFENMNDRIANMKNLRWISWRGLPGSSLPTNFHPVELCCLIFEEGLQTLLWEGYKYLPNLRMIKLHGLENLIKTPDFVGLPYLERFELYKCLKLEEIHPSIGGLERLVYLKVSDCENLKMFPPITRSHKLEIFELSRCCEVFKVSEIQQLKMESLKHIDLNKSDEEVASYNHYFVKCWTCGCSNFSGEREEDSIENVIQLDKRGKEVASYSVLQEEPSSPGNIVNLIGLHVFHRALRSLTLSWCNLRDGDVIVWDFPYLKDLDLSQNNFSRLNFDVLKLPQLKWLNVSWCKSLVELSGLPSSIAILIVDSCCSLESVGDISKCKWLWKVSLWGQNKLGWLGGHIVLRSMQQGNAIEHHFINFSTNSVHHIPRGLVDRLVRVKTFNLKLPDNWYNRFSGFLICIADEYYLPNVRISLEVEVEKEDSQSEVCQDHNEAPYKPGYYSTACVGYVSFNSLKRDTTCFNSGFKTISILVGSESWLVAKLVPRESNGDHVEQTIEVPTEPSEFYGQKPFVIQHHSKSSINILWSPIWQTNPFLQEEQRWPRDSIATYFGGNEQDQDWFQWRQTQMVSRPCFQVRRKELFPLRCKSCSNHKILGLL